MKTAEILRRAASEYGFDPSRGGSRFEWAALSVVRRPPRSPRPIRSPAEYVGICRRIDSSLARETGWRVDGRLVALGFGRYSPSCWVREGGLEQFLTYWGRVAVSPTVVGSTYNRLPDLVVDAWQAGIPASIVRALGPAVEWRDPMGGRVCRPLRGRRLRRLLRAARAATRTSVGPRHISTKALAALGRLSPELQRVALASLPAAWTARPVRIRDLDWRAVARAQERIARDPTGRARALLTVGRRQRAIYEAATRPLPPCWCRGADLAGDVHWAVLCSDCRRGAPPAWLAPAESQVAEEEQLIVSREVLVWGELPEIEEGAEERLEELLAWVPTRAERRRWLACVAIALRGPHLQLLLLGDPLRWSGLVRGALSAIEGGARSLR